VRSVFVGTRGGSRCAALVALSALVVAGCLGATASGSPSALPAANPAASASPSAATATATPAPIDLSTVPLAPSGTWKSIRWVSVPATPFIEVAPSATPSPELDASPLITDVTSFKLAGWSRGFVGFALHTTSSTWSAGTTTTTTSYSSDGVHWQAGAVLQQTSDWMAIRGVFEGPAGLLAVEESGACGDSWVEGLLTSRDGVAWQTVDMKKAFGKAVIWNVSGGSTGFVATDTIGHAVWTSQDGQNWRPVKLDSPAFATSRIDDGTAFSAGYVLVGSTEVTGARSCAVSLVDPSAAPTPTPTPPSRLPTVWWSADGADWVKAQLPGAKADYTIHMWVRRVDDHTLAAFDYYDNTLLVWASSDGRTWKPLAQPVTLDPISDSNAQGEVDFLTDGRHGVQIQALNGSITDPFGYGMSISTWTDGGLVTLAQSGDQPPYEFGAEWAVGPTGVVVTDAGQLWIGLPSPN